MTRNPKSVIVLVLIGWAAVASAAEKDGESAQYSVEAGVRQVQGTYGFELGDDSLGTWSKLEWPLDGLMADVGGEVAWPLADDRAVLVRARYGRSLSMTGTSTDRDWRPWERPDLSDYSRTDCDGTLQSFDLRAGILFPAGRLDLALLVGYSRTTVDFEDDNLVGSYDYGATPMLHEGPVDTYSADLSGVVLGGEISGKAGDRITLSARVEVMPGMSAVADAEWIRRGDSFSQDASGIGFAVAGTAGYRISERVTLTAEVEWTTRTAEGSQSGTQYGVPYDEDIVRELTMEYVAAGVGMAIAF